MSTFLVHHIQLAAVPKNDDNQCQPNEETLFMLIESQTRRKLRKQYFLRLDIWYYFITNTCC
jgi:hypothetical protein